MRGRVLHGVVLLVLVVLLAGGGYVGWVQIQRSEPVELLETSGQFAVGRSEFEWTDPARKDPFARDGSQRRLSVWVWYPAPKDATGPRAEYAPGLWTGLYLKGPVSLLQGRLQTTRTRALLGVPVAPYRFPTVVLMPGMGLSAPQYAVLAEELASHGYVVAGATPTYSADLTVLDGRQVRSNQQGNPGDLEGSKARATADADRIVQVWADDARFVARSLVGLNGGEQFGGRLENASSYVGHAFGGAAALEACRADQNCRAAVDLDGPQFGKVVGSGLKAPVLLLGSEDSCITGTCGPAAADDTDTRERAQRLLQASTGTRWCGTIDGARHFNFTDYGAYYLALPLRKSLPLGEIEPERALAISRGYVVTFLDHAVRAVPAPGAPACQVRSSS